jgi:hypothetical protein
VLAGGVERAFVAIRGKIGSLTESVRVKVVFLDADKSRMYERKPLGGSR